MNQIFFFSIQVPPVWPFFFLGIFRFAEFRFIYFILLQRPTIFFSSATIWLLFSSTRTLVIYFLDIFFCFLFKFFPIILLRFVANSLQFSSAFIRIYVRSTFDFLLYTFLIFFTDSPLLSFLKFVIIFIIIFLIAFTSLVFSY